MGDHVLIGLLLGMILCTEMPSVVDARSTSVFQASVYKLRHGQHHEGEGVLHEHPHLRTHPRKLSSLVETPQLLLPYHSGPILAGDSPVRVNIVWYGEFSELQRAVIVDFFGSFSEEVEAAEPSVRSWWKVTQAYTDASGTPVSSEFVLKGQVFDDYSKGKTLTNEDIEDIVERSVSCGSFSRDPKSITFVLTASDVHVGTFCMNSCGSHHFTAPSEATGSRQFLYAWVGNAVKKCAGRCAWPFAKPVYGPQTEPLLSPNGDVGIDGMIINIATVLAGSVTNPYNNAYFQGDASAPLEAATACAGVYGEGAFPGHPGSLLVDQISGASYNSVGIGGRQFLLPALWDPTTLSCRVAYTPAVELLDAAEESGSFESK